MGEDTVTHTSQQDAHDRLSARLGRLALADASNGSPTPNSGAPSTTPAADLSAGTTTIDREESDDAKPGKLLALSVAPAVPISPLSALLPRSLVENPLPSAENLAHARFMREALDMAHLALRTNETPVGCVLVHKGQVIAKGMNATNVTRNGTRHAEYMAIGALLSYTPQDDVADSRGRRAHKGRKSRLPTVTAQKECTPSWGDVDPSDGHLYPYGQKLHPAPRVDRSVIADSVLYVTVEPCVMCASLLRQLGIKKVYFGAVNDKFGGTGGVFRIHVNADLPSNASTQSTIPVKNGKNGQGMVPSQPASSTEQDADVAPSSWGNQYSPLSSNAAPAEVEHIEGHGGNVEPGYEAEGGWGRDEAVTLLRQFYVQENGRAPVPRKKEGRAARLAAMMERDGHAGGPLTENGPDGAETSDSVVETRDILGSGTPVGAT